MRGCGTVFVDKLEESEEATLYAIEKLALRYEFTVIQLRKAVAKCRAQHSIEGLDEMVAFSFNAQQFTPNYGGGGANLPPGKYKGVIAHSEGQNAQSGQGGFLALTLTPIEGALTGQKHIDRLNLHHTNPKTVEIANQQLSAYCHVLGKFQFNDTAELHNIPFCFEIGWQKGQEPGTPGGGEHGGYTEVKAIFDANGNPPGKAGAGPAPAAAPATPPATPPAGVAATGGAPAAWGGGAPAPAQSPSPAPAEAAPAAAPGGWGAPAGGAPAAAPAAGGGAAPWGAPAGGGAAPAGGAAPWGAPAS